MLIGELAFKRTEPICTIFDKAEGGLELLANAERVIVRDGVTLGQHVEDLRGAVKLQVTILRVNIETLFDQSASNFHGEAAAHREDFGLLVHELALLDR